MNRVAALLVSLVFASSAVSDQTMSFAELQNGTGPMNCVAGSLGTYDQLNVFRNPAVLSRQPNKWGLSLGSNMLFNLDERAGLFSLAYMGRPNKNGALGFAVTGLMDTMAAFNSVDLYGNNLGALYPKTMGGKLAIVYQVGWAAFGMNAGYVQDSFASNQFNEGGMGAGLFDFGTAMEFGNLDLAGVFSVMMGSTSGNSPPKYVSLSGAWNLAGQFKGNINAELAVPMLSDGATVGPPMSLLLGSMWKPNRNVEMGFGLNVLDPMSASFGLGGNHSGVGMKYSIEVPFASGTGLFHRVSLSWNFGVERTWEETAEAPRPEELVQAVAQTSTVASGDKPTLAIADLDPQNVSAGDASVIADMFRTELVKQGYFSVIEKSNMEKVLSEQSFQQTGCTSSECAVKIGKILNARYLIVGSFGKLMGEYIISFRMVDVESANVVYSDNAKNLSTQSQVSDAVSRMATRLGKAMKLKK